MTPIDRYRAEFEREGIGTRIQGLLGEVVFATALQYSGRHYAEGGAWTQEALENALQGWTEDRLIRRNDLERMISGSESEKHLRAQLTTSFSQWLINTIAKGSAYRLFKRTEKTLNTDSAFTRIGRAKKRGDQFWTISQAPEGEASRLSLRSLVAIAGELSDKDLPVEHYGEHSLKSSPILRKGPLREFLLHLLSRSDGALDLRTLATVMEHRFALVPVVYEEFDDRVEQSSEEEVAIRVELDDLAGSVLSRLNADQMAAAIAFEHADRDLEVAAESTGADPEEIEARLNEIFASIAELAQGTEEARAIYERVVESLL